MSRRLRLHRAIAAVALGVTAAVMVAAPAQAETVRHLEWYLDALHVPEAQQVSRGDGVTVAVVEDDPVDATHPDLAGQVLPGYGPDNGWGSGTDAVHATGMAAIIAAKGGGDQHALGIAPGAKILPVVVNIRSLASGIRWAVDHGAKVINVSAGVATTALSADRDAVKYALDHNVVVVAAVGNHAQGAFSVASPANVPGVVAVSAVDSNGGFDENSAKGPEVVLGAPGINITTAAPFSYSPSGYQTGDGTSEASAIVSGTAALIRAKFPNLDAANVIERLVATAKDQPPAGRDQYTGFGTVRVLDALTEDVPTVTSNPLGSPVPASSGPAAAGGTSGGSGGGKLALFGVLAVGVVLVIVVLIVIVVAATRRKSPPAPVARPGPYPPAPPPGYPPAPPPYGQGPPHR